MHLPLQSSPSVEHRHAGGVRACRGLGWLLLLAGWLSFQCAAAEPAQVQVLLSDTGGAYGELLDALRQRLDELAPGKIELHTRLVPEDADERAAVFAQGPELIVPIGIRATALTLKESGDRPVLSLLVPYDGYSTLLRNTGASGQSGGPARSAIYLDQPLERQLELLRLVLPKARRIASLTGPHSAERSAELKALSDRLGLQLDTGTVSGAENPVPALSRLLDNAEALLALPDPAVFNRSSLQAILLTTYRSGVPVFGFSQAYVRAGALAAVHSTATQIGTQAGEWIAELAESGRWELGTPRYPSYYSVAVNKQVARTLGIEVADEGALLEQLRDLNTQRNGARP